MCACLGPAGAGRLCPGRALLAANASPGFYQIVNLALQKRLQLLLLCMCVIVGPAVAGRALLAANSSPGFYQGSANTMAASNTAAAIADAANGRIPASYATRWADGTFHATATMNSLKLLPGRFSRTLAALHQAAAGRIPASYGTVWRAAAAAGCCVCCCAARCACCSTMLQGDACQKCVCCTACCCLLPGTAQP